MPETRGKSATGSGRWIGRAVVPADERVVFDVRPSLWMVVLRPAGGLVVLAAVVAAVLLVYENRSSLSGVLGADWLARWSPARFVGWCVFVAVCVLGWVFLDWLCRRYVLTERRAILVFGVLHQRVAELPAARIQNVGISKPLVPRVLGLGHVGVASAGTDGYEVVWRYMRRPEERAGQVRRVASGGGESGGVADRPVVIGIAGGVGSGKSTVARLFGELGCVVVDSDELSREALRREDVKSTLRGWWGDGVFTDSGEVDRSAVARIVFGDAGERRRLEGLIHPLIEAQRAERMAGARADGARGVVIDAPLLFEAGLERETDAVVFVESPRALRLERVRSGRGWDEAELEQREKAQMPLEEKARRSDHTIVNAGDLDDLRRQVSRVFTSITEANKAV